MTDRTHTPPAPRGIECEILAYIGRGHGGFTTGDIAQGIKSKIGHTRSMQSGAVLSILKGMEAKGMVSRIDDQKPIAWGASLAPSMDSGEAP